MLEICKNIRCEMRDEMNEEKCHILTRYVK